MKAILRNYRQSPRKVRLVAKFVRGKNVAWARAYLRFLDQKSAEAILNLINSALANAGVDRNDISTQEKMLIKEIRVDEGMKLKRWMPRAFGRAAPYRKKRSHIFIQLAKTEEK